MPVLFNGKIIKISPIYPVNSAKVIFNFGLSTSRLKKHLIVVIFIKNNYVDIVHRRQNEDNLKTISFLNTTRRCIEKYRINMYALNRNRHTQTQKDTLIYYDCNQHCIKLDIIKGDLHRRKLK